MNWDVEKTRSENCQSCILRRRTCGKTSLQLILSDSTTLAYEQPPPPPLPRWGGGVGWREHYIQLAIQLKLLVAGFHCSGRCVRITESGVRKVTGSPSLFTLMKTIALPGPRIRHSFLLKYERTLQSSRNGLMSEALGIFCEITHEFLVTTKMQDCRKTFHLHFIE